MARIISNLRANNELNGLSIDPEVARAEALYYRLKAQHVIAKGERIKQWFSRHPEAKDFVSSDAERKRDIKLQEWLFLFVDELRYSPEQRYQRARSPAHGFGHEPTPAGIHQWSEGRVDRPCVPGCRYFESSGSIGTLEVLSWFEGYDQYQTVLSIWCEKQEDAPTQQ